MYNNSDDLEKNDLLPVETSKLCVTLKTQVVWKLIGFENVLLALWYTKAMKYKFC